MTNVRVVSWRSSLWASHFINFSRLKIRSGERRSAIMWSVILMVSDCVSSCRSVRLNGVVLKMVDDKTLPDLKGLRLPPTQHLQLPAYSLAFFVLTDARAAGCVWPHTHTHAHTQRQTHTQTDTHTQTNTHADKHTHRDTHTWTDEAGLGFWCCLFSYVLYKDAGVSYL